MAFYKKMQQSAWTLEELDLAQDRADFEKLAPGARHFISMVLAFFSASDGLVNENIGCNFAEECAWTEVKMVYRVQALMECVHQETYAALLDTLVQDKRERELLFEAADQMECIRSKAQFMQKYMNREIPFGERLAAFCLVEGVLFSGSFCAINYIKAKSGVLMGLTTSNSFIARDEALHTEFSAFLYTTHVANKLSPERFNAMLIEAVDVEIEYVQQALDVQIIGINAGMMVEYVKFVANYVSQMLGYEPVFQASNPFPWSELNSLNLKTNMFEARVDAYKVHAGGERAFNLDQEF